MGGSEQADRARVALRLSIAGVLCAVAAPGFIAFGDAFELLFAVAIILLVGSVVLNIWALVLARTRLVVTVSVAGLVLWLAVVVTWTVLAIREVRSVNLKGIWGHNPCVLVPR